MYGPPEIFSKRCFNPSYDDYYDSEDDSDYDDYYCMNSKKPEPILCTNIFDALQFKNLDELTLQVDKLIQEGKSINCTENGYRVPLIEACASFWPQGVELLLKRGADPNAQSESSKSTALFTCCEINSPESASLLIQHGADVNAKNEYGMTPLLWAASKNAEKVVDLLLDCKKTEINATDPFGQTALFFAKMTGNTSLCDKLVNAGVDPLARAMDGTVAENHIIELEPQSQLQVSYCFDDSQPLFEQCDQNESCNDSVQQFLNEALGGFPTAAQQLIEMSAPGITLRDVLSGDQERLKRCGVKLSYHRRTIVELAKHVHLDNWSSASTVPPESLRQELSLSATGNILQGVLRQLVFIEGALDNMHLRTPCRHTNESQKPLLLNLIELYVSQQKLQTVLMELQKEVSKVKACPEIVYIKENKSNWPSAIFTLCLAAIVAPICFIFSKMKRFNC